MIQQICLAKGQKNLEFREENQSTASHMKYLLDVIADAYRQ